MTTVNRPVDWHMIREFKRRLRAGDLISYKDDSGVMLVLSLCCAHEHFILVMDDQGVLNEMHDRWLELCKTVQSKAEPL